MKSGEAIGLIAGQGYVLTAVELPDRVRAAVRARDWEALDAAIGEETRAGGAVFEELRKYVRFDSIEFIISIRSSREEPDEDGIWHDDGSRVLAFSLSVTLDADGVEGGRLGIRRRVLEGFGGGARDGDDATVSLRTPPFGAMIVFATGHQGFEHRIHRVTGGERIVIAGWCT